MKLTTQRLIEIINEEYQSILNEICEVFIPGRTQQQIEGEEARDKIIEN